MDNLQSIWNQLNDSVQELGTIINSKEESSIFKKLKKEEALRKKYNPLLAFFIVSFMVVFSYIVYSNASSFDNSKILGIVLVTLSGICIAIFTQIVKMPLQQFEHDQSSMDFLQLVKEKLDQSKMMLVVGILLQFTFLITGLYLLIFYNVEMSNPTASICTFLGVMLGLGGFAVGSAIAFFNHHYKETYSTIRVFLNH